MTKEAEERRLVMSSWSREPYLGTITHFCAMHAQFMQCMRYDVRKYRDGQKETLVCMYQDLGGY